MLSADELFSDGKLVLLKFSGGSKTRTTTIERRASPEIWLFKQKDLRIEGRTTTGFNEYMNLVLDEAEEVSIKKKTRKPLERRL
ncbi:hypothetical protein CARUB_v10018681mg [Capsella rubella]|uniref:Sm domain-containing protein n=1 Tax=Capsella rubella TaxID=81985 RepID=R0HHM0_9BRAS|nr:hypothetical protein CARUB_v10018681mg [Capsella rubella]